MAKLKVGFTVGFAAMLIVCSAGVAWSGDSTEVDDDPLRYRGPARSGDSVWLINTRDIKKASAEDPGLQVQCFAAEKWEPAELDTLATAVDADTKTIVYVHGYDFTPEKAERVGWAMYHTLTENLPEDQPLRLVVWSWPATAIKFRMVRDIKDKIRRTNAEAYFLAWFLSRTDVDAVIGSAMGCRIVSGSMHLLAGKAPTLNTVVNSDARTKRLRTVLITAAIDDDWLLEGKFHGKAISQVKQMLLINNSMDPLLANFAMISRRDSVALGVAGVAKDQLEELADRLQQVDAAQDIGKKHGVENYLRSPATSSTIREFVLADE